MPQIAATNAAMRENQGPQIGVCVDPCSSPKIGGFLGCGGIPDLDCRWVILVPYWLA